VLLLGLAIGVIVGAVPFAVAWRRCRSELDTCRAQVVEAHSADVRIGQAEDELQRLWAALDALSVGVVLADATGTVRLRNAAAEHPGGSRHGDLLVATVVDEVMSAAIGGARPRRVLELSGPPRRVVVVHGAPLGQGGGVVTVEDVTERSRLDSVRTDFVANISHELKTPVGALSVLAEAVADADDADDMRRLSSKMVDEAHRVARTIDDLLELSRIELGGDAIRVAVDVHDVLHEAGERVGPLARALGIHLDVRETPDGLVALGDRRQLVSALGNLVENSVKYSEPGGEVVVSAAADGDWVELVVADHGIGIPERDLDRIFERFYRVDKARSRATGGTGLGLAIVRHVASNHGGEVTVTSAEGVGSTFRLRIPTAASPVPTAPAPGSPP
jgi:two-component system sensor histidine kinase SenX3